MIAKLLISKNRGDLNKKIGELLLKEGLKNPHPDLLYFSSDEKLGIEQAREIKKYFSLKPYSNNVRAVVLENASNLTIEAQNALLKILEELPEHAMFLLCCDSDSNLLPTVLSRCQIINPGSEKYNYNSYNDYTKDLEALLKTDIKARFEYIEKLKAREEFFFDLINYFHQKLPENFDFVKELPDAEKWQRQNVNLRAILEYLMLVMPKKM